MRENEDDDLKRPQPVQIEKKGAHPIEIAEIAPWRLTRQDEDRDRHRRVV